MTEPGEKKSLMSRWFGRRTEQPSQEPSADEPSGPAVATPAEPESPHTSGQVNEPLELVSEVASTATQGGELQSPEPATTASPEAAITQKKASWFQRLKDGLTKTSSRISDGITAVFAKRRLDAESLQDLEDLLIQADLGVETSMRIVDAISKGRYEKGIGPDEVRAILADEVAAVLQPVAAPLRIDTMRHPHVILVVGVNGTGKTTTIGKLANQFIREGRSVVLAAGDTFRAAAIEQLKIWGERIGAPVFAREVGGDAASLAFDALTNAKATHADILMIDTAGRLQNKQALMSELEKVIRVVRKIDPDAPHDVLLVLDATTGQNALNQVEVFKEKAGVTGLVMTKLDGTARGGILVAIAAKYKIPVHAIGVGEGAEDLQPFVAEEFAKALALN